MKNVNKFIKIKKKQHIKKINTFIIIQKSYHIKNKHLKKM